MFCWQGPQSTVRFPIELVLKKGNTSVQQMNKQAKGNVQIKDSNYPCIGSKAQQSLQK
jgi:hypothetical protein